MARQIAQREPRNDNAKTLPAVAAGETFVVTRNGEPVAEIRPAQRGRRTFVPREEIVQLAGAGVRIDATRSRDDLDAVVDQSLPL